MSKAQEILDGWAMYVGLKSMTEVDKEVAVKRAEICSTCPHAIKSDVLTLLKENTDEFKKIQSYKCDLCGCPLSTKVRSMTSSCPDKKW